MSRAQQAPTLRSLLAIPAFRRLLIGQGISGLGDWVGTVAFIAAALELTGSPFAVGAVLVIRLVPPMFAAPIGGALSDRLDRRAVMVGSNLVQAALIAAVPFVGIAGLYAIAFVHESVALLFLPARDATVPDLVPAEGLTQANGLVMATSYAAIPFAFALFSGLRIFGLAAPFFFDAATFVASAILLAGLPRSVRPRPVDGRLLAGALDGFRYARGRPVLRALGTGVAVAMFGGGVLFAVGISFVHSSLGAGDVEFGYLASLWGLGMALGLGAVRLWVHRGDGALFRIAVASCGAVLVVMALFPVLWLAFAAAVVFGVAFSVAVMLAMSLAQSLVTDEVRGRLMGAVHLLFRVGLSLGALGIGGLASLVDSVTVFGVTLDGNQVGLIAGGALILSAAIGAGEVRSARVGRD